MDSNKYFLITDIGSTTTKALLIANTDEGPKLLGIHHANTTVEAPFNDVRYGVEESINKLEKATGITLLKSNTEALELVFDSNVKYFATSSAGGGLQILVIGLTLFDSASSARRAAFGAGGVILDVFAIDDKRKASEQMLAMRNLHPDMILLCGGTDGGALTGVLRLTEILRIAKPMPKYATSEKIPTIYSGNIDAQDMVKRIISEDFDLVILPNLRPKMDEENLKPTQDMIQKLFMENVMERAPGYPEIKKRVLADILPTPMGVLKSLITTTTGEAKNFFAFDIGGATTDVFSYIKGFYQRTVSANLGMSYSALNVLAEARWEKIEAMLPPDYTENEVRNYIGNKTIYPSYEPCCSREIRIEHVLAKQAIRLAICQHQDMHYNTQKVGFIEKLKNGDIDEYEAKFNYVVEEAKYYFYPSEIDVVIGAGGIFAHAQNVNQCISVLIDAFDAHGITELWIDNQFISPHLGVLSDSYPKIAKQVLLSDCMEKLALHIRPYFPTKLKKQVMHISYIEDGANKLLDVMPGSFILLPGNKERSLRVELLNKSVLGLDTKVKTIQTGLPVIIDTRLKVDEYSEVVDKALRLYPDDSVVSEKRNLFRNDSTAETGEFTKVVSLPFKGEILVNIGDKVMPDDILAANKFNPPRLFIVNPYKSMENVNEDLVRSTLLVKTGEEVDFNTNLRRLPEKPKTGSVGQNFTSPIRGLLEYTDFNSGLLVFSEIQDYSSSPVKVHLSEHFACKPKIALRYLDKERGDFVYHGDVLAKRMALGKSGEPPLFVHAPTTGEITEIDPETATLTIQYRLNPQYYYAHVQGQVIETQQDESVVVRYKGTKINGKLGLGKRTHGMFVYLKQPDDIDWNGMQDKIIGADFIIDNAMISKMVTSGAKGLICPGINQSELVEYTKTELGVVNTGNENIPLSIVITEGFGIDRFSTEISNNMKNNKDKLCHLEPHTRIRAGVARPFVCFM